MCQVLSLVTAYNISICWRATREGKTMKMGFLWFRDLGITVIIALALGLVTYVILEYRYNLISEYGPRFMAWYTTMILSLISNFLVALTISDCVVAPYIRGDTWTTEDKIWLHLLILSSVSVASWFWCAFFRNFFLS